MPQLQSAYRRHSSAETAQTALLKVLADVCATIDRQRVTLLGLLDLSAAFDCVDHDILLSCRLRHKLGICGAALDWIASFLCSRSQQVYYKGRLSVKLWLLHGVPQRVCFWPSVIIDRVAGAIIRLVASVCVCDTVIPVV